MFVVLLIFPCTGVLGGPEGFLVFGDGSNVCAHPANTEVYIGNMMRERERERGKARGWERERERDV